MRITNCLFLPCCDVMFFFNSKGTQVTHVTFWPEKRVVKESFFKFIIYNENNVLVTIKVTHSVYTALPTLKF